MTKTLIVARWQEPVEWTENLPRGWKLLLVQKDVDLPNLSLCVESFYWGVVKLYPTLKRNDLVACVQGNPFDHCPDMLELLEEPAKEFRWLGDTNYLSDGGGRPHDGGVPVAEIYEKWVGAPFPGEVRFGAGGQFIARADLILRRPLQEWQRMQVDAGLGRNDWAFERCEEAIFTSARPSTVPDMPTPKPKRRYYTLKKDVPLKPGQTAGFTEGRGYYAKGTPTPTPKPKPEPVETPVEKYVGWCRWAVKNNAQIHYAQARPMPVHLPAGSVPFTTDCSGFVTLMAKWAGRSDPNGLGYSGEGYTGTMLNHCEHITAGLARPGDLIVYGPGGGHHVVSILKVLSGGDFEVCSHGKESDPILILHSVEREYQPAPVTFLHFR